MFPNSDDKKSFHFSRVYNIQSKQYPSVLHANGFSKMMLPWLHNMQAKCAKSDSEKISRYKIPEELFFGTKNRVFRKFMKTTPWIYKHDSNYCSKQDIGCK